jgi:hypothetical protein
MELAPGQDDGFIRNLPLVCPLLEQVLPGAAGQAAFYSAWGA